MKILTATTLTQGDTASDFDWCHDGEIVIVPVFVCDTDRLYPERGCGCGRSWTGVLSRRGTTTALVGESDLSVAVYTALVGDYLRGAWSTMLDDDDATELANRTLAIAERFEDGAVVQIRLDDVTERKQS